MRIMVFDVPAESGGALSVLNDFYREFREDNENEYIFVISLPKLKEAKNIKVLNFPWIKKSWIHRLYFDHIIAPMLIKRYRVDKILSLQNMLIPHTHVTQELFVHNALPFSEYKFRLKEDKILWIYQNIIGKKIIKSIKKSNHIIVQTEWMKNKFMEELNVSSKKISIKTTQVNFDKTENYEQEGKTITFFYPASGVLFKNHEVIINACLALKKKGISNYRVVFTLKGDESKYVEGLFNIVKINKLPIEFKGPLKRDEVFKLYSKSTLLFSSYIETVGLPLIEAINCGTPIIASNSEYALEILKEYDKVSFFDPFNHIELSEILKEKIKLSEDVFK